MKKTKVLCFTDDAAGRDVEMLLPLRYFAERFLNCEFHHALNIEIHQICRIKPDVILQANTIGSNLYFEISRIAYKQNIPLFALISEGNFRTDGSFNYWGFNRDKKFYQDYVCCWSERTAEFLKEKEPQEAERIVVTGGAGFDRYIIYKFLDRKEFLRKYNKEGFKKIIGYAGWAFGKLYHTRGRDELLFWAHGDESKLKWIEEQRCLVRNVLREAVVNNPDTLFVLKQHPQENAPERPEPVKNEMSELAGCQNVLYLCTEESIHDLISVADLWTCFESTTALESWLMGKQTIFINPEPNFNRDELYKGSPLAKSYSQFQNMVNEFFVSGKIESFVDFEKTKHRNELIGNIIGFGDGFNHIRASKYFAQTIAKSKIQNPKFNFYFWHWLVFVLIRIAAPFYNRKIYSKLYKVKKHLWVFENYRMEKLNKLYAKYVPYFDEFYKKHNIEKKFFDGSLFNGCN
ncbi:MAG: BFO_1060 family glycosyltransferase [Bacteroidota bacterium]